MTDTVVDKIYAAVEEDILSDQLKPGQRLPIVELAEKFQVGTGPVREALCRLLDTGLVIALSRRGFRVAAISQSDLHDIYATRSHIEALALRLAIQRGDDAWEANIVATHHRLEKFEETCQLKNLETYKEWEARHQAFNFALINACGLAHLLNIQRHLYKLTERYRRKWLIAGIKQKTGLTYAKDQRKIMGAALARNSQLAENLLQQHFKNAVKTIETYFMQSKLFSND